MELEPQIWVAIIGLAVAVTGGWMKVLEKRTETNPKLQLDRQAQLDEKLWKYVEKIEKDSERAVATAEDHRKEAEDRYNTISQVLAALRTDYGQLQGLYQSSVNRAEELEVEHERDKNLIKELRERLGEEGER